MSKGPYYREALAKEIVTETPSSEEERLRWINVVAGSPEEVAAALNDYLAETGVDRLDVMMRIAGMDLEDVHLGMRLMREEVAPHLESIGRCPTLMRNGRPPDALFPPAGHGAGPCPTASCTSTSWRCATYTRNSAARARCAPRQST